MSAATLSLIVLVGCIALFVWNRLPVGVVAILTGLALYFTGVLDATQVVAGFGDPWSSSSRPCSWSARAWSRPG